MDERVIDDLRAMIDRLAGVDVPEARFAARLAARTGR